MARAFALLILSCLIAAPAGAVAGPDGFEDIARLESRVVAALDADVATPGGPLTHLDRRLKLAACPKPVTIDPPALGALPLRCEPLGWRIRVPLMRVPGAQPAPGTPAMAAAQPATPAAPPLIRRGDPVELRATSAGFTVSTAAIAQEDGRAGGKVRVKTDARGPVVIGDVVDTGIVRVASF
ncbi:flagella basal body P-ring formation protein FlgA [Sphingomonas morindae]|uniref:Flagella basal body P-ring formation protein FlgA n=1 Tax=Sphingomonas morindae TaxID=1541170 RepID=A0ABY4X9Y8_9SPHN|nr:flagella basal body P-ring formation protein FlgA [Sphingomonas morindae]USI73733.1 flagella basal body P-ring formation protein FlgA [Sphingomonas morindae]